MFDADVDAAINSITIYLVVEIMISVSSALFTLVGLVWCLQQNQCAEKKMEQKKKLCREMRHNMRYQYTTQLQWELSYRMGFYLSVDFNINFVFFFSFRHYASFCTTEIASEKSNKIYTNSNIFIYCYFIMDGVCGTEKKKQTPKV